MTNIRKKAQREGIAVTRKTGVPDESLRIECTFIRAPYFPDEDTVSLACSFAPTTIVGQKE
jgi:hypothetical protein